MATISAWFNNLLPSTTKDTLSKSRSFKISRYVLAALLILLSILVLVAAWYSERVIRTATLTQSPSDWMSSLPSAGPVEVVVTQTSSTTANVLRTYSTSLYSAALAFGILGILLGITVLGVRKQPASIVTVSIAVIFIVVIVVLVALLFGDTYTKDAVTDSPVTNTYIYDPATMTSTPKPKP